MPRTLDAKERTDRGQAANAAIERLQASIDAAETALRDLRSEVSRDSRDLLVDLGKTLRDARRNLARSRRRILKDLEQIPQAFVHGKPTRSATRASASARTGSRGSGTARSTAPRKTASRATSD